MALWRSLKKQELQIANCKLFGVYVKKKKTPNWGHFRSGGYLQGQDPAAATKDGEQIPVSYTFSGNRMSVSFYCVGKEFVQIFPKRHSGKTPKEAL